MNYWGSEAQWSDWWERAPPGVSDPALNSRHLIAPCHITPPLPRGSFKVIWGSLRSLTSHIQPINLLKAPFVVTISCEEHSDAGCDSFYGKNLFASVMGNFLCPQAGEKWECEGLEDIWEEDAHCSPSPESLYSLSEKADALTDPLPLEVLPAVSRRWVLSLNHPPNSYWNQWKNSTELCDLHPLQC